jgi:hypothetical protein
MKLAGGGLQWSMRTAIDIHAACPANPFTTIVIERYRIFSLLYQFIIQDIEHFQEGHIRRNMVELIAFERPF